MAKINNEIVIEDLRITKLRSYLLSVIDTLLTSTEYQINANMLSSDPINYSLDKIPEESTIEKWVMGTELCRDVYSFRSRVEYSQDAIVNLKNVGFFEIFEQIIKEKNKNKELPNIEGVESIECLNCGSMTNANTNTAVFDIQIQITYRKGGFGNETNS